MPSLGFGARYVVQNCVNFGTLSCGFVMTSLSLVVVVPLSPAASAASFLVASVDNLEARFLRGFFAALPEDVDFDFLPEDDSLLLARLFVVLGVPFLVGLICGLGFRFLVDWEVVAGLLGGFD